MKALNYFLCKLFAIVFTIGYFTVLPNFIKLHVWPKKVENTDLFLFLYTFLVHEAIYILLNLSYAVLYNLEWNLIEAHKVHDREWPWKEDKKEWIKLLKKSVKVILTNQFVIVPVLLYLSIRQQGDSFAKVSYELLPSNFTIFWQILFFILVEDFLFYWVHRFLHWKEIYPYIHKLHHDYKNTVSIASEHAHFSEFILGNVIPMNMGALLLPLLGHPVHALTIGLWIIVRIAKTSEAHSGYQFALSPIALIPLGTSSDYHNYHHDKFTGNYGSFLIFWDSLCGTVNPGYYNYFKKITEKKDK